MPPPLLHLFHPDHVCIEGATDGSGREQNRSKVESDLGEGKWRRQFRVSFGTWNWRESERREIILPAAQEERQCLQTKCKSVFKFRSGYRIGFPFYPQQRGKLCPFRRVGSQVPSLTSPTLPGPCFAPPNFCHILPRFSFCRRNSERR